MKRRSRCNLALVAKWRHIQSIHEATELRNPDTLVRRFLPVLQRWHLTCLGQKKLAILRSDPFYYYLVARTKYYDEVFLGAISANVKQIINVGCGTDTRSIRFEHVLKQNSVKILECDQPEVISNKQRTVQRWGTFDHIAYVSIDLNDDAWSSFEHWLTANNTEKTMVLMEGVSPYINVESFGRFLSFLAKKLPPGSRVAYDFKLHGVNDDFSRVGRTQSPFRLPAVTEQIVAYHAELGYRLNYMALSSELSVRILPSLGPVWCYFVHGRRFGPIGGHLI